MSLSSIVNVVRSDVYSEPAMKVLDEQTNGTLVPMLKRYERSNAVTQVEVTNYYEVYVTVNDSLKSKEVMRVMTDLASLHPSEINLLDMHGSKSVNTLRLWWD